MWFLKVKKSSDASTNSGVSFAGIINIYNYKEKFHAVLSMVPGFFLLEERNLVFRKRKHKNIKLILQIGGTASWSVQ